MAENPENKMVTADIGKGFNGHLYLYFNFNLHPGKSGAYGSEVWDLEGLEAEIDITATSICREIQEIPGVKGFEISRFQLTVHKYVPEEWADLGPRVQEAIERAFPEIVGKGFFGEESDWP